MKEGYWRVLIGLVFVLFVQIALIWNSHEQRKTILMCRDTIEDINREVEDANRRLDVLKCFCDREKR